MAEYPIDSPLSREIQYVKGVGPKLAQTLKKLDIHKVADLVVYAIKAGIIET